jgi:uncharacterized protein
MLSVKPWRPEAVLILVVFQAICVLTGAAVMGLLQKVGVPDFKSLDDSGCILVGTMAVFFRYHHVDWREELGFKNKNLLRSLLLTVALVVVILPAALGLQIVCASLMNKIGWKPTDEIAVTLLTNASTPFMQIYLFFFAVVLAPVAEEFIFRGVLFPFLKQLGLIKTAWIGVNLFFAFIHGDAEIFLPLFVLALALTWLYEKTDNLLAPMVAHGLFNAINLVILKYASQ